MLVLLILLIFTCVLNCMLGVLVFSRDSKSKSNFAFLTLTLSITLWAISDYLTNSLTHLTSVNFFNRIAYIFALLAVYCGYEFTVYFCGLDKKKQIRIRKGLRISMVVASILSATTLFAGSAYMKAGKIEFSLGSLIVVYAALLVGLLYAIVYNFIYFYLHNKGEKKYQVKFILFGFSVTIVLGIISNMLLPIVTHNWKSTDYGPTLSVILVASIAYAIIRHRLFNIRLAIIRFIAYLATLTVLATGFAVFVFVIAKTALGLSIDTLSAILISVAAALLALIFQNLKTFFDRLTSRLFYQDDYDPEQLIDVLNRILISTLNLNDLLKQSSSLIAETLKANYCAVAFRNGKNVKIVGAGEYAFTKVDVDTIRDYLRQLETEILITDDLSDGNLKDILNRGDVAALVALDQSNKTKQQNFGYIILGTKKSGNPYSNQDFRVLDTVAKGLVLAVQNSLRFAEIERFNQTLQEKIDKATKSLRQTNDKLRALDATKDDFISMASHQLRTPLTSIKGYLSMLKEGDGGKLNQLELDMIGQAYTSSQRMVYLISDMLNVSRLKTGKFAIELSEVDLASVVEQEVDQLKDTAASKNIKLTFSKPDEFPLTMLDDTKIRQVIMNFIDNAIYYTPEGGKIVVTLEDLPSKVEFKVKDTGIGVPKNVRHHLFTKFFRAENARKARPDGTGLGIYMAKKVIIAQGGAIIFESKEGKGSTFGFVFYKSKLKPLTKDKPLKAVVR